MTSQNERERVVETLPEVEGGISPEAIARAKAMIGARMRTENFVRDASLGALLNFVNGIGDTNPIFRDQEYAGLFQVRLHHRPPLRSVYAPLVGTHTVGSAGVHGFFAGNDWEYFRNIRPGRRGELRRAGAGRTGTAEPLFGNAGNPVRGDHLHQPAR